ncbi:spore germination protein GerPE [Falsibacillus albus]|nr:spore germination protein GerPE [Falsibacillus albus]
MNPFCRQSIVQNTTVDVMGFAAVIEIGDSCYIRSKSNVLATQRERELFFDEEGSYEDYPIFNEPIPIPHEREPVYINKLNANGTIRVNKIRINGISNAAILHIGSTNDVYLENRTHHIRQLIEREEELNLSLNNSTTQE